MSFLSSGLEIQWIWRWERTEAKKISFLFIVVNIKHLHGISIFVRCYKSVKMAVLLWICFHSSEIISFHRTIEWHPMLYVPIAMGFPYPHPGNESNDTNTENDIHCPKPNTSICLLKFQSYFHSLSQIRLARFFLRFCSFVVQRLCYLNESNQINGRSSLCYI